MKYLVLGNGWIGNYIYNHLKGDVQISGTRIENMKDAFYVVENCERDRVIINCIGKTGRPNIDWCEDHKQETTFSNVIVPYFIAEACERFGKYWMHVGSGCVYNEYQKAWTEEDEPNYYGSYYSTTKAISQDILKEYNEVCILRIRMPIDKEMSERSYVAKLLKYIKEGKSLLSEPNSITYLPDMILIISWLAKQKDTGIFNVVNPEPMSAAEILSLYDPKLKYKMENAKIVEGRLKAKRSNCILSTEKIEKISIHQRDLSIILEELWWLTEALEA